jgi:hypothetical protein
LQHTIEDLEKWNSKSDLKERRSREIETVHVNSHKLKNDILNSTNLQPGELKKIYQDDTVVLHSDLRISSGKKSLRKNPSRESLINQSFNPT